LYFSQRRFADAAAAYEEALAVFRAVGDLEDHYYAECLHGYTSLLNLLHRYEENLVVVEEATRLTRRIYGETAVRPLLLRKAVALQAVQRYEEAREILRHSLAALCAEAAREQPPCSAALRAAESELNAMRNNDQSEWPIQMLSDVLTDLQRDAQDHFLPILNRLESLLDESGDPAGSADCQRVLSRVAEMRR
jgi:hypothetical protein